MMDRKKTLQNESRQYWKNSDNTFLGPPEYYTKQQDFLEKYVFPLTNPTDQLLDIGCGNGHFTLMFLPYCHTVTGLDISRNLITEAQHKSWEQHPQKVSFILIDDLMNRNIIRYDIVLCMGVTATIIDENEFLKMLVFLKHSVKPGGYLILKDMLRQDLGDELAHPFQHNITRVHDRYLSLFHQHHFELVTQETLLVDQSIIFKMFVMQKSSLKQIKGIS